MTEKKKFHAEVFSKPLAVGQYCTFCTFFDYRCSGKIYLNYYNRKQIKTCKLPNNFLEDIFAIVSTKNNLL